MNKINSSTLNVIASYAPPYVNPGNPGAGQLWLRDGEIKVFDGHTWIPLLTSTNIELSSDTQAALHWAHEKMREETRYSELAQKHVSVADALNEVQRAQEKLQVVVSLCESPE